MPYSIKITGINESQKLIEDTVNKIKLNIKKLGDQKIKISVPGVKVDFEIEKDEVTNLLKKLPSIMQEAHSAAVRQMVDLLEIALNESIESPVWNWNGDNRDIVDSGDLRDSLSVYADSDDNIIISYGEEYAAIVHYGGYFNPYGNVNVKLYYPGRPWVSSVLEGNGPVPQFEFQSTYKSLLSQELNARI